MLAELATQIACVYVYVDECLKASLCLLAVHKYICIIIQACTACFSQRAEQVNGSSLFSHGPGHMVRCSPTQRPRWMKLYLVSIQTSWYCVCIADLFIYSVQNINKLLVAVKCTRYSCIAQANKLVTSNNTTKRRQKISNIWGFFVDCKSED